MHFCNAVRRTPASPTQCHDGVAERRRDRHRLRRRLRQRPARSASKCKSGARLRQRHLQLGRHSASPRSAWTARKDGAETDKDCGGGTCPACAHGLKCADGTRDCSSTYCNATQQDLRRRPVPRRRASTAARATSTAAAAPAPSCATGSGCKSGNDCTSTFCNKDSLKCVDSQCKDGFKDYGETDIDCGGGSATSAPPAPIGKGCGSTNANCTSGVCNFMTGAVRAHRRCSDGRVDGAETDIDCGGGTCTACGAGQICKANSDCGSARLRLRPVAAQVHHRRVPRSPPGRQRDRRRLRRRHLHALRARQDAARRAATARATTAIRARTPAPAAAMGQACCDGGDLHPRRRTCAPARSAARRATSACRRTRSPARRRRTMCQMAGTCNPSTGTCCGADERCNGPCDQHATDQCCVANSSTCASGTVHRRHARRPTAAVGNDVADLQQQHVVDEADLRQRLQRRRRVQRADADGDGDGRRLRRHRQLDHAGVRRDLHALSQRQRRPATQSRRRSSRRARRRCAGAVQRLRPRRSCAAATPTSSCARTALEPTATSAPTPRRVAGRSSSASAIAAPRSRSTPPAPATPRPARAHVLDGAVAELHLRRRLPRRRRRAHQLRVERWRLRHGLRDELHGRPGHVVRPAAPTTAAPVTEPELPRPTSRS